MHMRSLNYQLIYPFILKALGQPLHYCPATVTMGIVVVQFHAGLPCAREGHPVGCPSPHTGRCTEPAVRPGIHKA